MHCFYSYFTACHLQLQSKIHTQTQDIQKSGSTNFDLNYPDILGFWLTEEFDSLYLCTLTLP